MENGVPFSTELVLPLKVSTRDMDSSAIDIQHIGLVYDTSYLSILNNMAVTLYNMAENRLSKRNRAGRLRLSDY